VERSDGEDDEKDEPIEETEPKKTLITRASSWGRKRVKQGNSKNPGSRNSGEGHGILKIRKP